MYRGRGTYPNHREGHWRDEDMNSRRGASQRARLRVERTGRRDQHCCDSAKASRINYFDSLRSALSFLSGFRPLRDVEFEIKVPSFRAVACGTVMNLELVVQVSCYVVFRSSCESSPICISAKPNPVQSRCSPCYVQKALSLSSGQPWPATLVPCIHKAGIVTIKHHQRSSLWSLSKNRCSGDGVNEIHIQLYPQVSNAFALECLKHNVKLTRPAWRTKPVLTSRAVQIEALPYPGRRQLI